MNPVRPVVKGFVGEWTPRGMQCARLAVLSATVTSLIVLMGNGIYLAVLFNQIAKDRVTMTELMFPVNVSILLMVLAVFVLTRAGGIHAQKVGPPVLMIVAGLYFMAWYASEALGLVYLWTDLERRGLGRSPGLLALLMTLKIAAICVSWWMLIQAILVLRNWPRVSAPMPALAPLPQAQEISGEAK